MDAAQLSARNGEHAERIRVAKIILPRERQTLQVSDRGYVARIDVGQALPVERYALVDVGDQRTQPLQLQCAQLLARQRLQLRLEDHARILVERVFGSLASSR